jgi:hypothetical protein
MPRGRPIKRAPAPRTESTHVIHPDGSYTNESVTVTAMPAKETEFEKFKKNVKLNTTIKLGGKLVGYVYCIYDHGVRVKPRRNVNPDLGSCKHISWEMIQKDMEV